MICNTIHYGSTLLVIRVQCLQSAYSVPVMCCSTSATLYKTWAVVEISYYGLMGLSEKLGIFVVIIAVFIKITQLSLSRRNCRMYTFLGHIPGSSHIVVLYIPQVIQSYTYRVTPLIIHQLLASSQSNCWVYPTWC